MWQQLSSECLRTSAICTCSDKQKRVSSAKWVGAELPSSREREIEGATRGERKIGPYAIYIRALLHHTLASSSVTPTICTSSLGSLINLLCGLYPSSAHVLLCLQTAHSFSRPSDVLISDPVDSVLLLCVFFSVPLFPNPTSHQVSLPSCKRHSCCPSVKNELK